MCGKELALASAHRYLENGQPDGLRRAYIYRVGDLWLAHTTNRAVTKAEIQKSHRIKVKEFQEIHPHGEDRYITDMYGNPLTREDLIKTYMAFMPFPY